MIRPFSSKAEKPEWIDRRNTPVYGNWAGL
jgi:hypothetical protein